MASKKYYSIKNILATDAQYMLLLGQRANGKSYQAKLTVLTEAYKYGNKFVYLRRWKEDIKQNSVTAYFADMPIDKITNNEWENVIAWNGNIYFSRHDDKGEIEKSDVIGRYCALNEAERYKSQMFVNYKYIIYEEFITDKLYLVNEPTNLQHFVSTVAREKTMHVIMVGNTLSRVCPYFSEWCLDGVLKQKQGTIEVYHYHTSDDTTVDIAVEYCATANIKNTMFFGQSAKQIVTGEWDTTEVAKLPKFQYEYDIAYEVLLEYQKFKFAIQLLIEPKAGGILCFVYPFSGKREIVRKITNIFSDSPLITKMLDISRRPEMLMSECFKGDKVCYSDNLTGADFKHVIQNFRFF